MLKYEPNKKKVEQKKVNIAIKPTPTTLNQNVMNTGTNSYDKSMHRYGSGITWFPMLLALSGVLMLLYFLYLIYKCFKEENLLCFKATKKPKYPIDLPSHDLPTT